MARWLVTDGDHQFSARDIQELVELARTGRIDATTMLQPPGAADWLYASEIPELRELLGSPDEGHAAAVDDELELASSKGSRTRLLAAVLALVALVGGYFFVRYATAIPDMSELSLLGGKYGLQLTEMLVTAQGAPLRSRPEDGAPVLRKLEKDSRIQLLAKRRGWYQVQLSDGTKGWVAVDQVIPAYYFADARERENYDPIYNPDKYLLVSNSRWMALPDRKDENVTVFEFLLTNKSKFPMKDIVLLATIKDARGNVLEEKEIPVEGVVPPHDSVVVGTWNPPDDQPDGPKRIITYSTFTEYALQDEDLWLQWSDGVEVPMSSSNYTEANIDLLQATAVTDPDEIRRYKKRR